MPFQSDEIICLDSPERAPKRARDLHYSSPEDDLPDIQAIFKADARSNSNCNHAAKVKALRHMVNQKTGASAPVVAKQTCEMSAAAPFKLPQEAFIEIIESDEDLPQKSVAPKALSRVLPSQKTMEEIPYRGAGVNSKAQKDKMALATPIATVAPLVANSLPAISPTARVRKPLKVKQKSVCSETQSSFDKLRKPNASSVANKKKPSPAADTTRPLSNALRPELAARPPVKASTPSPAYANHSASAAMGRRTFDLHSTRAPEPGTGSKSLPTVVTLGDVFDTAAMELDLSSDEDEVMPIIDPKDPLSGRTQAYLHPMAGDLPSSYLRRTDTTLASSPIRKTPAAASIESPNCISISSDNPRGSSPANSPDLSNSLPTDLTVPVRPRQEKGRREVQLAPAFRPIAKLPIAKPPTTDSWSSPVPASAPHESRVSADLLVERAAAIATGARSENNLQAMHTQISDGSVTDEDAPGLSTRCASSHKSKKRKQAAAEVDALAPAEKARQRAVEKVVRQAEKEAKTAERLRVQSISSVNVLKTNKKDTSPEMIVRVCQSLEKEAFWKHMQALSDASGFECRLENMPVAGLVRFSRKTKAVFNMALGYWEPLPAVVIKEEPQLMIRVLADAFLDLAERPGVLAEHVASVRQLMPGARIIYLLEGLHAMLDKSRIARNRALALKVRQGLDPAGDYTAITGKNKQKQTVANVVNVDELEDALLDLQVVHRCLIVHAPKPVDTARELCTLVQDMSLIPYKSEATKKAGFCIEPGQVKTGKDSVDTFEKMLASLHRITPPMAESIANKYSTIKKLHAALMSNPLALDGTIIGNNVDGSFSQRKIGSITSKNIARVVTSMNPHADASS